MKQNFYHGLPEIEECSGCHKKISNREWADNWACCSECFENSRSKIAKTLSERVGHREVQ